MMRIEAALRPGDLEARRDDRAVHVNREPALAAVRNGPRGHQRIDPLQAREMADAEGREPAPDRARRRQLA